MDYGFQHPALEQTYWDRTFRNPVGLAAGLDKNAEAIKAFSAVGFSHVEVEHGYWAGSTQEMIYLACFA